ncbi:esterase/lipase family protein, partial [Stenotrophomonas maltophilia]|uniref:esterase/lipase family protein n=3 Tax=Stenotrophomonas maltophilia TaxID=40324 RepID=UPI000B145FCB
RSLPSIMATGCLRKAGRSRDSTSTLSIERLSDGVTSETQAALSKLGFSPKDCIDRFEDCSKRMWQASPLEEEEAYSSIAEILLAKAIALDCKGREGECVDEKARNLVASLKFAYAYLFFGSRRPEERVFERRQEQVRQFYNRALEELVPLLVQPTSIGGRLPPGFSVHPGVWLALSVPETGARQWPVELVSAEGLAFKGVRNIYRRDGFGAAFIAVHTTENQQASVAESEYRELGYASVTIVVKFDGSTAREVVDATRGIIEVKDIYRSREVQLGNSTVPLAANYSAGYALWLSRSHLRKAGLMGLLARSRAQDYHPQVVLMEPFDPNRKVVILVHGLASSQEAWINLANEVLGDEPLREKVQIWQVIYPTRMPMLISRERIQSAIESTYHSLDPKGSYPASTNSILIGHSMGGVISRLMVSEPDDDLLRRFLPPSFKLTPDQLRDLKSQPMAMQYTDWTPLPQVDMAIFLAAPHCGTPVAERTFTHMLAKLVTAPIDTVVDFQNALSHTGASKEQLKKLGLNRMNTGVDDLASHSQFMRATCQLPISKGVSVHSIIARRNPAYALERSSDGFVPYTSAHLAGAQSELVVTSGHSVQETPEAILEIRRILRESISLRRESQTAQPN